MILWGSGAAFGIYSISFHACVSMSGIGMYLEFKMRIYAPMVANGLKCICIKIFEYIINVPYKSTPKTSNFDVYRFLISFVVSEK